MENERMEISDQSALREAILKILYSAFSEGRMMVGRDQICESLKITEAEAIKLLNDLNRPKFWGAITNDSYYLLPEGVIFVEQNKLVSSSMIERNVDIRDKILEATAKIYHEAGPLNGIYLQAYAAESNTDINVLLRSFELLESLDLVTSHYKIGDVEITELGLSKLEELHLRLELFAEFKSISDMEPHRRGKELERFVEKLMRHEGWSVEKGVKTSNEEIDLVIYRDQSFYLVECKWEKHPIGTKEIGAFFAKLDKRDGVMGIVLSMSGFTKGAKEEVLSHLGGKRILLFGPGDLEILIEKDGNLEKLITEKSTKLVINKEVLVA